MGGSISPGTFPSINHYVVPPWHWVCVQPAAALHVDSRSCSHFLSFYLRSLGKLDTAACWEGSYSLIDLL